jgi:BetR domain
MNQANLQVLFFQHLKAQLPPHIAMVDEIAELLEISNDSAYRRIRGEKPIDLEETYKLCDHFKLSIDQLLHLQSDAIIFSGRVNTTSETVFEDYLKSLLQNFQMINSFEKKHIYVLMKDIPPFVHFQIPELAIFKFYFWMKSILHDERLKKIKFSLNDPRYMEFLPISKKVIESYNTIPVTEIWNIESINSSLRQIDFYRQSGMYENKNEIKLLYEKVEELINHIERQAELGVKFFIGNEPGNNAASYNMFVNELVLGDNTYLVEMGPMRLTFLNHSVLYFVGTPDEQFNNDMSNNINNLVKKSTQLSSIGEKERVRFFNRLRDKIHHMQSSLS